MLKLLATLLSAPILASGVSPADHGAQSALREFYGSPIALGPGGMPAPAELDEIAPFLSTELVGLISDARAKEVRCAKVLPSNIKPPMWEGGVFSGMTEGATRLVSVAPNPSKRGRVLSATLELVDARFPVGHEYRRHTWRVDAAMIQVAGRWRIDDLVYDDGSSLRAYLVKSRRTSCNWKGSASQ